MVTLLKHIILFALMFQALDSFSACNFSTIQKTEQGYLYSKECHIEVGRLVKSEPLYKVEITSLRKTIELKDLRINKEVARAEMWRKTAIDVEKSYNMRKNMSDIQKYLYMGLGVIVSGGAIYAGSKISK